MARRAARQRASQTNVGTTTGQAAAPLARPSALLDTRIIYCGDCLDQLRRLPDGCVDRRYL
jgi:hypothetical protein